MAAHSYRRLYDAQRDNHAHSTSTVNIIRRIVVRRKNYRISSRELAISVNVRIVNKSRRGPRWSQLQTLPHNQSSRPFPTVYRRKVPAVNGYCASTMIQPTYTMQANRAVQQQHAKDGRRIQLGHLRRLVSLVEVSVALSEMAVITSSQLGCMIPITYCQSIGISKSSFSLHARQVHHQCSFLRVLCDLRGPSSLPQRARRPQRILPHQSFLC